MNQVHRQLLIDAGLAIAALTTALATVVGLRVSSGADPEDHGAAGERLMPSADAIHYQVASRSSTKLMRVRETDLKEMRFQSGQGGFHVRRDQNTGRWFYAEHPGGRLNADEVVELLDEVNELTPATNNEVRNLNGDIVVFTGVLKLGASPADSTIEFMGSCKTVPAFTLARITHLGTAEYCVDATKLRSLLMRGFKGDTRLFTLRVDEVESLAVSTSGHVEELRREGTSFLFGRQRPSFVELEAGNRYLLDVLNARGQFVSADHLEGFPQFDPTSYVRLRSSVVGTDDYQEMLLLGAVGPNGSQLVQRTDDNAVLRIDRRTADLLRVSRSALAQGPPDALDAGRSP